MVSVGEGDGLVQVCATLSAVEATDIQITITLTISDGTGIYSNISNLNSMVLLN